MKGRSYDIRPANLVEVRPLFEEFHGYKGVSASATYCFAVYEGERIVAAYAWQPPPVGCAKSVAPECPHAVLSLSRMVAIPKEDRQLNHISKPLRHQMNHLIDRGRWPVLVTFSDEGMGHTGHVYQCSGWEKTTRALRQQYVRNGIRTSPYRNGKTYTKDLIRLPDAYIQRWEHWACPRGQAAEHLASAGWIRVPIPGKVWKSGNQAMKWVHV
jgi:hypothetical protein